MLLLLYNLALMWLLATFVGGSILMLRYRILTNESSIYARKETCRLQQPCANTTHWWKTFVQSGKAKNPNFCPKDSAVQLPTNDSYELLAWQEANVPKPKDRHRARVRFEIVALLAAYRWCAPLRLVTPSNPTRKPKGKKHHHYIEFKTGIQRRSQETLIPSLARLQQKLKGTTILPHSNELPSRCSTMQCPLSFL